MVAAVKTFGLNRTAFHLASVFLHVLSGVVFGLCLLRAFPGRPLVAALATTMALALPTSTSFTYFAMGDPARLSMLLIWLSIYSFQSSARKNFPPLTLGLSCALYVLSFTVYENGVLFMFVVPLFVLPILLEGGRRRLDKLLVEPLFRLGGGLFSSGLVILAYRYGLGFADTARGFKGVPTVERITDSLGAAWGYLSTPFLELSGEPWAVVFGLAVAAVVGSLLLTLARHPARAAQGTVGFVQSGWYLALLGALMFVLGIAPFLLADVGGAETTWNAQTRLFSSAGYGIALLVAVIPSIAEGRLMSRLITVALAGVAGVWVAFWFELRVDWQQAADMHCRLWRGLLDQVPYVSADTTLLFVDLRHDHGRVHVFAGSDSLLVLMQLLYKTPGMRGQIYAYHLERREIVGDNVKYHAAVTPQGVVTPTSKYHVDRPLPLDSVILVSREGDKLVVTDRLTAASEEYAIHWRGVSELRTNPGRVRPSPAGAPAVDKRLERLGIRCSP